MNHVPVDYNRWTPGGQGSNVAEGLSGIERKIWDAALPFQDKREDPGHTEFVTYFALKLVRYNPESLQEVVVPAAILHDIGWSQLTQKELDSFYLPSFKEFEFELRRKHEEKGAELAKQLLTGLSYPEGYLAHIYEIISQHDTRKGFYSAEDGLMRDADKLWRFTLPHFQLYMKKRGKSAEYVYNHHVERMHEQDFFFSDTSREVARMELEHTIETFNSFNKSGY